MELPTTGSPAQQSVEELMREGQRRWLRPVELLTILQNSERHLVFALDPQINPPSGSFFAIKRDKMREFRKDGHNWIKKKDGKTVQESHEKLKVGNVEKLKCLYVRRQDNENFHRRIYSILDQNASDVALFHYLEVKTKRKRTVRPKGIGGELSTSSFNLESQQRKGKRSVPWKVIAEDLPASSFYQYQRNKRRCERVKPVVLGEPPVSSFQGVIAGSSSGIVDHDSNQLPLPPKTADTRNQKNIEGYVESAVGAVCSKQASSGFHFSSELPAFAGLSDTCYGLSLTGNGMQDDKGFENQSLPQMTMMSQSTLEWQNSENEAFHLSQQHMDENLLPDSQPTVFPEQGFDIDSIFDTLDRQNDPQIQETAKESGWSHMIGEMEVSAEKMADDFFVCHTTEQEVGLACTEVPEFECGEEMEVSTEKMADDFFVCHTPEQEVGLACTEVPEFECGNLCTLFQKVLCLSKL